jgi:hypothetical protein
MSFGSAIYFLESISGFLSQNLSPTNFNLLQSDIETSLSDLNIESAPTPDELSAITDLRSILKNVPNLTYDEYINQTRTFTIIDFRLEQLDINPN